MIIFVNNIKGTRIQSQFLFLMEKSILYAKITVSQKIVSKLSFKYYIGLFFHSYNNVTHTH